PAARGGSGGEGAQGHGEDDGPRGEDQRVAQGAQRRHGEERALVVEDAQEGVEAPAGGRVEGAHRGGQEREEEQRGDEEAQRGEGARGGGEGRERGGLVHGALLRGGAALQPGVGEGGEEGED